MITLLEVGVGWGGEGWWSGSSGGQGDLVGWKAKGEHIERGRVLAGRLGE